MKDTNFSIRILGEDISEIKTANNSQLEIDKIRTASFLDFMDLRESLEDECKSINVGDVLSIRNEYYQIDKIEVVLSDTKDLETRVWCSSYVLTPAE